MADFSGPYQIWDLGAGCEARQHVFATVELDGVAQFTIARQHRKASVAHDRGVREYLAEDFRLLGFVSRLLSQFAQPGSHGGRVCGIDYSPGTFQLYRVVAMAKLLDHHQLIVGREGHHVNPIDTLDDEKIVRLLGPWRDFLIGSNAKNPEIA